MEFIDKHKILYKKQFSFQKGKSTQHAILDLYLNIVKAINELYIPGPSKNLRYCKS